MMYEVAFWIREVNIVVQGYDLQLAERVTVGYL
jgi:hypothetical protein